MKKFIYTVLAVTVLAAPAWADYGMGRTGGNWSGVKTHKTDVEKFTDLEEIKNGTFRLNPDDPRLQGASFKFLTVKNSVLYLTREDGTGYIAPNGPYEAEGGLLFYALDGRILRVEAPQDVVYMDVNRNGRFDPGVDSIE